MVSEHQIIALLEQLERKVRLLTGLRDDALLRIAQLERENDDLQKSLKEQQAEVRRLQKDGAVSQKNARKSKEIGKIVEANLSGTDANAELKQQLDAYIGELDRCIAYLSSLS